MNQDDDSAAFHEHPFVRALAPSQIDRLLAHARPVRFADGAFVFREGDAADALYLLRSGCVVLEQHVPGRDLVRVEELCAGDLLGLSWLFPPAQWTLDARCATAVEAYALDAARVRAEMGRDPVLGHALLQHVVHALYNRLVRVRLQRLDVYAGHD